MIFKFKYLPMLCMYTTNYGLVHIQIGNCVFVSNSSTKTSYLIINGFRLVAGKFLKIDKFWRVLR